MSLTQGDMGVLFAYLDEERQKVGVSVSKSTAQHCRELVCAHCAPLHGRNLSTAYTDRVAVPVECKVDFDHTRNVWTHTIKHERLVPPSLIQRLAFIWRAPLDRIFVHEVETEVVDCPASRIINTYRLETPQPKEGMGINTAAYSEPYTDAYGSGE
jgi:hypothetical protein